MPDTTTVDVFTASDSTVLNIDNDDATILEVGADKTEVVATGEIGLRGPAGPPGATGAAGPPGPAGPSSASYRHVQGVAASTWTITHNFGYKPGGLMIIDSAGTIVEGSYTFPDGNTIVATFTSAFAGEAYVS
jgi:hypothetical protein